jgi:hypothetical protein
VYFQTSKIILFNDGVASIHFPPYFVYYFATISGLVWIKCRPSNQRGGRASLPSPFHCFLRLKLKSRLWGEESIPGTEKPSYIGWAGRYDNPTPTWLVAHIAGLKLPTLFAKVSQFYRDFIYSIQMEFNPILHTAWLESLPPPPLSMAA